jgi:translocation and assembly module TamB
VLFRSTEDTIELYGDLLVSNASVTLQNQDIGDDGTADSAAKNQVPFDILVDISIETGRRVEFFWPTTNFPILRSFAAPEQHLTIAVDSSKGEFSLLGDITIQGGEVSYLQRNFLLTRGEISFNENENRFDPRLTFEAILRDMSSEGEPIKIFLNVNNQPLSRFEPRFTSEPSMSDAEIIAVLGASLPSRIGQEALDITAGLALTGSMVSQLGILNSFESRVKEVLNLDLFSIRTYMIQNLILDRVGSVITNEAVQGSAFSRYLDNTSIFLGKYFGNDLFIQGTLQIQANDAFTDESIYEDELFIDSEISIEWETPLFLLDFAIRPDFINPLETVNNASLGLRWGFSY